MGKQYEPFTQRYDAILAALNSGVLLTRKQGQFLGGELHSTYPLSEKQAVWLGQILEKCNLPPLVEGGAE